jgi:hypothetical protein
MSSQVCSTDFALVLPVLPDPSVMRRWRFVSDPNVRESYRRRSRLSKGRKPERGVNGDDRRACQLYLTPNIRSLRPRASGE